MEMKVHLDSDIFDIVRNGSKDVEVRLNDEKKQQLKVGDTLIFLKRPLNDEEIKARVIGLDYYDDFSSLVENYEMKRLYLDNCSKEDYLKLMNKFYPLEEQKEYGAVAIRFKKW
jgi:ASC-1-like (ASCH) protein